MNLLNQKMLIENVVDETSVEETIAESTEEIKVPTTDDNDNSSKIEGKENQLIDNESYSLTNNGINILDEIEERITNENEDSMDSMSESVYELSRELEQISIMLENVTVKAHAAQYNLLTETTDNAQMHVLYESTISTLWTKFIEALKSFIEKAKSMMANLTFKAVAYFDYYGKWANKYEENLRKKSGDGKTLATKRYINGYEFDRTKLFQNTDFSRLHEYAATIIGNATTTEDMERKLNDYIDRKFTADDIYSYIISKCCGVHVSGNDKTAIKHKVIEKIKGETKTITVDNESVRQSLNDLRSVRTNVMRYASASKTNILNPEFDRILESIKKELDAERQDTDNIRYKYYRARYDVFSKAQQAAFDIYQIKIRCIKDHADQCMKICKTYVSTTMTESIDVTTMNTEIPSDAVVLD